MPSTPVLSEERSEPSVQGQEPMQTTDVVTPDCSNSGRKRPPSSESEQQALLTPKSEPDSDDQGSEEADGTSAEKPKRKRQRLDHLSQEEKTMRRKMKNRVAAQYARDRKKVLVDEMAATISDLRQDQEELVQENDELKEQNERLEQAVRSLREALIRAGAELPAADQTANRTFESAARSGPARCPVRRSVHASAGAGFQRRQLLCLLHADDGQSVDCQRSGGRRRSVGSEEIVLGPAARAGNSSVDGTQAIQQVPGIGSVVQRSTRRSVVGTNAARLESGGNKRAVRPMTSPVRSGRRAAVHSLAATRAMPRRAEAPAPGSPAARQLDSGARGIGDRGEEEEDEVSTVLPDIMDLDLDQMLESMAFPDLLSPLSDESSAHSAESGYDTCSSPSDDRQPDDLSSDTLTDLFPDLVFDPTSLLFV